MRIGVDARELAGPATGVGRYLAELIARWTREPWAAGHHLVLFAPRDLDRSAGWHGTGGAGCEVQTVKGAGGTWWEQGPLAHAARHAQIERFFAPGYTAPLRLTVPVVVSMHDVSFAAHPEWFRWREGLRQRWLARWTAARAARIVTLSAFSRDEIVRWLGVPRTRIEVIPPAVDPHAALRAADGTDRLPAAGSAGDPTAAGLYILYVGSIFVRRHVPSLIAAFERLARIRADVRLVLVGADRSWPPQHVGERLRRSGVADRIAWLEWAPEHRLRQLYAKARVFAFLSEYEGFGLTPLEALSAGVPPVVADSPVARDAYGDAAIYVDPRSCESIVTALATCLDDGPVRTRSLDAAPATLARYTWDTSARRTFEVISAAGRVAQSAPPRRG
jgi:glycosyltransferase involved in cell wall biosynthesis